MKSEKDSFLAAIEKNPCDGATRLVFSDYLEERGLDDEAAEQRRCATKEWQAAYRWMAGFAERAGTTDWGKTPITYEMAIQAGHDYVDDLRMFIQAGQSTAQDSIFGRIDEWWTNWEILTGRTIGPDRLCEGPFGCSC